MTPHAPRLIDRGAHRIERRAPRPRPASPDWSVVALTACAWLRDPRRPTGPMMADETALARAARDGAVIWDIRPTPKAGRRRKLRGVSLGAIDWVVDDSATGRLTDPASIARVLGRIGIAPGSRVIVYADRAADGFVALRALRSIGVDAASMFVEPGQPTVRPRRSPPGVPDADGGALASFWASQARHHPTRAWRL